MSVRRIYSELLPYDDVMAKETVRLLDRYRLSLVLAVRPWDVAQLPRVAGVMRDAGVPLGLWPMVDDAHGRWASARNTEPFAHLVHDALDVLPGDLAPAEVLLDLEPPFEDARALSHGGRGLARIARAAAASVVARSRFDVARASLAALARDVHARGVATSCAVWPLVALDAPRAPAFQRLLGTPVDRLGLGRVSVMLYTTIFEGWSRGLVDRSRAARLLARLAKRTQARWGSSAGVSLGCVGIGALGDEPVYRSAAELAEDVAIVQRAGIHDLSLFDLGGVLARGPAEPWLAAFSGEAQP